MPKKNLSVEKTITQIQKADRKSRRMIREETMKRRTKALIRHGYEMDAKIKDIADYADVALGTLYRWLKEDPEFKEECERLRTNPRMRAREKVITDINKDVKNAQWYLERKVPDEFSQTVTKKVEGTVNVQHKLEEMSEEELMKLAYPDAVEAKVIEHDGDRKQLDGGAESVAGEGGTGEEGTGEEEAG